MWNVFEEADNSHQSNIYFMFDSHEIIIDTSELTVAQVTSLCPLQAARKMRKLWSHSEKRFCPPKNTGMTGDPTWK